MRKLLFSIGMLTMLILINTVVSGQGITTSSINGTLTSTEGEVLPGCIIVAIHQPSGSKYVTTSGTKGDYNLPDLKVGGPYLITISLLGYKVQKDSSIFLDLGEELNLNYKLASNSTNLNQVVISGKADKTFNSGRTGSNTNISAEDMQMLPSVSRSLNDYTRLTPEANNNAGGMSYAGANNRYNNFSIDGSVNNDVFGLSSSGTNGGTAGTQPISLDAIQTINVAISPYDVKQGGFTGAGINAVTKSGANNIFGDVYYFLNNQNLVGRSVIDSSKESNYSSSQMGISLGGPIIKDKLFFFVNGESTDASYPSSYNIGQGSKIADSTVKNIENKLMQVTDGQYNGGGYGPFTDKTTSDKIFARIDWNINTNNKLTIRNNYVQASEDNLSRSLSSLTFNDGGYTLKNKTNNTVMELDSRFSNKVANELRIGYTTVSDNRICPGNPFPSVTIDIPVTPTLPAQYITLGSQYSSMANSLDQNITTISDNLNIYLNKNKITIGTEDELYHFKNLFIQDQYGNYVYSSYSSFMDISQSAYYQTHVGYDCANYTYYYSTVQGQPDWAAQFNAEQLGFYAQDEISLIKNVKITAGVRVDVPVFPDKPVANNTFDTSALAKTYGVATTQMPKSNPLISPRLGFNWDVNGQHKTQIRGGTGIFTGRIPFVWLSNQYSNTGMTINRISDLSTFVAFNPDPNNQISTVNSLHLPVATTEVDVVAKNFKFAQTFRTNLAVDQKLPFGIKATIEGIYTKKINDISYQDLTMSPTVNLTGVDDRPVYPQVNPRIPAETKYYTHIMYLSNTNQGYSYSLTGKLQKEFKFGLGLTGSYTYNQAYSTNDGVSSVALSNWQNNYQYQATNNPELGYSEFAMKSRFVGVLTYKIKYANHTSTILGIFYNGQSGEPYSYCYTGDLNNDGNKYNDIMFVPAKQSDINLIPIAASGSQPAVSTSTEWAELNEFIENDKYLSTRRGEYAERNGARTPFENHLDFRVAQDFYLKAAGKKHTLEISFDVLNFANLFNSKWGRSYYISYNQDNLITFIDYAGNKPEYTFTQPTTTPWEISDLASRWRAQIGVRYSFD